MSSSSQTQELLNAFFQGIGQRDAAGVAKFFAEPTSFYISKSPVLPWTGNQSDRAGVIRALDMLSEAHTPGEDKFETDHIFIDGEEAAVFGTVSRVVKKTGKRFKADFTMRFTLENGLIIKMLMLEDSRKIEEAFSA